MIIPTAFVAFIICAVLIYKYKNDSTYIQTLPLALFAITYVAMLSLDENAGVILYIMVLLSSLSTLIIGIVGKKKKWPEKVAEIEIFAGIVMSAISLTPLLICIYAVILS